jgi:hypothetical protein
VLVVICACNIRNYSNFLKDNLLFGYFEYIGNGFIAKIARMAADLTIQRNGGNEPNHLCVPLPIHKPGEWNLVNSSCPIYGLLSGKRSNA